ncbi:hypothetical protein [Legionella taurinensis]|uniref:hypothetical protein n=1 Tax=Legionella taurinensis TaxID=70611 RepID=UPI001FD1B16C|nr:hypothetical protein [Legionella taurinensis]MDX1838837.1 hypothetical protein [Legionella taurinensis]
MFYRALPITQYLKICRYQCRKIPLLVIGGLLGDDQMGVGFAGADAVTLRIGNFVAGITVTP